MRNALILLGVVALVILVMGALNNGTTFEVDYVAGTVSAVSLFWVSAVIAALVFVAGLAATWFALSGAAGGRRKLEAELQSTYERLREAEALAARPAPAPPQPVEGGASAAAAPTVVEAAQATVFLDDATVVAGEGETIVVTEEATVVAQETGQDAMAVSGEALTSVPDEDATTPSAGPLEAPAEPGEQTAVTTVAPAPAADEAAGAEAERGSTEPAAERGDEPRPSGP